MTTAKVTAEVFWAAFRAMDVKARNAFLKRLFADRRMRKDLMAAAGIEARQHERTCPFSEVLAEARKRRAERTK